MTWKQNEWMFLFCPILGRAPFINIVSFIAVYTGFKAAKPHRQKKLNQIKPPTCFTVGFVCPLVNPTCEGNFPVVYSFGVTFGMIKVHPPTPIKNLKSASVRSGDPFSHACLRHALLAVLWQGNLITGMVLMLTDLPSWLRAFTWPY